MPWHQEAMKDAEDCDKLRGAVNRLGAGDLRRGQPGHLHRWSFKDESIVLGSDTWGSETSQYPQEQKSNDIA